MSMPLRERAARRICEVRGQDPDRKVHILEWRPFWEHVAQICIDPALNREACQAIEWARQQEVENVAPE